MLDVHPPHGPTHGVRDFLIHLFTITIGLLIALGLEGAVEWRHHRHLVHEAEKSLHEEIAKNAHDLPATLTRLHKQQEALQHDVVILREFQQTHKFPKNSNMEISFSISTFPDVSWKTAQSTGALSYMPYDMAQEYSSIYSTQGLLIASEQQAARDAVVSLAPFIDTSDSNSDPTLDEGARMLQQIQVLQGQLFLVNSLMEGVNKEYTNFLAAHPEK